MADYFPIIQVNKDAMELLEQKGNKSKSWLHIDKQPYLFKIGRPKTGEDWSEKVACELCSLLGLPHAHYDFAVCEDNKGVLSKNIVPDGGRLVMGNELLAEVHSSYPEQERYGGNEHNLVRIVALLSRSDIRLPIHWSPPDRAIKNAVDVFLGYLLLDAWIANQDRHHENWGVVHFDEIYLAPTYDHAASMGQNEQDAKRKELLTTRDRGRHISRYIERARSAIYLNKTDRKPPTTLGVFQKLATKNPEAAKVWIRKLGDISSEQCQEIFNRIPPSLIGETAIEFALTLLKLNKERLLQVMV